MPRPSSNPSSAPHVPTASIVPDAESSECLASPPAISTGPDSSSLLSGPIRPAVFALALRGLACVQIPLAFLIVYVGALRGAGDSRSPMIYTALSMALVRVPLAYLGGIVLRGGLLGA